MDRKYGISTISLVPFSLGKMGFENSLDIARELGLDGIQALPMRGWPDDKYYYAIRLQKPRDKLIMSFGSAWNSGTIKQALARTFGSKKEGLPTFLDLYLFGRNPKKFLKVMDDVFGWGKFISQNLKNSGYRYMVEIGPNNVQVQNYLDYKHGLVWDTWHVREAGMPNWRDLLSKIPYESIKMIHFHPKDEGELAEFVSGGVNELAYMLHALRIRVSPNCPLILEIRPRIGSFVYRASMMKRLRLIRDSVFDILG